MHTEHDNSSPPNGPYGLYKVTAVTSSERLELAAEEGSANQLLSALALLACAVFLKKTNRKGFMLWVPMTIMFCVTMCALFITIYDKIGDIITGTTTNFGGDILQLFFAIALVVLGAIVATKGYTQLIEKKERI